MRLDFASVNYEHGGLIGEKEDLHIGDGYGYDFTGLVRIMGKDDRWPHAFAMGEGDKYEFWGGWGAWAAIDAMAAAGGRNYAWLLCSLPREAGPFAPVIFYDPQAIRIKRYYTPRAPDFAQRTRNLLIARAAKGGDYFRMVPIHGQPWVDDYRTSDAKELRWLSNERKLTMIVGDFNEGLSGPGLEPTDLTTPSPYPAVSSYSSKVDAPRGRIPHNPRRSTGSLDFLCGWWDHELGERVNGVGFHDVCEAQGINVPTDLHKPIGQDGPGREGVALDHIIANTSLIRRLVPGSVQVDEPVDPDDPDSDHKRVSATFDL